MKSIRRYQWFVFLAIAVVGTSAHAVLQVKGRFLYNNEGQRILIRGGEQPTAGSPEWNSTGRAFDEIRKCGGNAVRILLDFGGLGSDERRLEVLEAQELY